MTRPRPSGPDDLDPLDPRLWPAPPEPSEARWAQVRSAFDGVAPARRPWWKASAAAVGTLVASALIAWVVWPRPVPVVPPTAPESVGERTDDPLAEYDVLPIATAADVMVSAVRGGDIRFGSIDHPVPNTMPLASAAEVIVSRGPTAGELSCPEPGDAPLYMMPTDK
jgi:hypothetical protein